jgi:hypothetical protein
VVDLLGVKITDRVGEVNVNSFGSEMVIVNYNTGADITVQFTKDGNVKRTNYSCFKKGNVRNPYDITLYGIGYLGDGEYESSINNKPTKVYKTWEGMLRRGYDKKFKLKSPSYKDATVCKEWHCFQTFADWYFNNYYEVEGERMNLDKDILVKGNKVYSPQTCIFVPARINALFVKNNRNRGDLPIGVSYNKREDKYIARCSGGLKMKTEHIGNYITPEEAFLAYKFNKELIIKDTANEYKGKIPNILYDAMIKYKVEMYD